MIIETGIGGKKDITMMFDAEVAIITSIDKDHMDILGKSLPEIAAQKGGHHPEKRRHFFSAAKAAGSAYHKA